MKIKTPFFKGVVKWFACVCCCSIAFGQHPSSDPAYQIVFSDDFTGTAVNYNEWARIPPWNQGSNFIQVDWCNSNIPIPNAYRKWKSDVPGQMDVTNCEVSNGTVKLHTRKENYTGEVWSWPNGEFTVNTLPFEYTTAMLYSKAQYRFGYFEIKFKLPSPPGAPLYHKGFGPNFWLFGDDQNGTYGTPSYWGEIDIFELNSWNGINSNHYTNNAHYRGCNAESCHISNGQEFGYISNNVWHTAAVNWTPSKIEYYLDGTKLRDFPCEQLGLNPSNMGPMNIWVDVNSPAINFCTLFDNTSAFPYTYEIDYVKVWQLKQDCYTAQSYCNFVPANYTSKLYSTVTLGGTGCSSPITNQSSMSFHATNYVLLNEGVSIDAQSNVILNTENCATNIVVNPLNAFKKEKTSVPSPPPASFIERQKRKY